MPEFQFHIGAKVHCKDDECGVLKRVIYNPHTREVSDLVISIGTLFKKERVLPIGVVERTTPQDIYLVIDREQYEGYPEYQQLDETEVTTDSEGVPGRDIHSPVSRVSPYGISATRPFYSTVQRYSPEHSVTPDAQVLERDTDVLDSDDEKIGSLDHLLLDQETCQIAYLVIDRGMMQDSKVIPESAITEVSSNHIRLNLKKEDLAGLPGYIPRGDENILSEAQEYLKREIKDTGMQVSIDRGVMHLSGCVRNVMDKRRAEAAARSIQGVVDVKNDLKTDSQIQALVSAALHNDRRTELSLIQVESTFGIVTLRGVVDTPELISVAQTIAALQPGVNMVQNELAEEHDEFTPYLRNRQGWEIEKMKGSSYFPG